MRIETVVEILKALPGVRIHVEEIEYTVDGPPILHVKLTVNGTPEPDKLVITVEPGERPGRITFTAYAGCGAPGHYTRTKYCVSPSEPGLR